MNDQTHPKPDWKRLNREQKGALIAPLIRDELLSYAQIGRRLGVSRLAIASAAWRNEITSPLTTDHSGEIGSRGGTAHKARQLKNPKVKQPRPEPRVKMSRIAPTQPMALPDDLIDKSPLKPGAWTPLAGSTPMPLHDLKDRDCKWPLGEGPFGFCGQPAAAGRVYCAHHAALAYKPIERNARKGTAT